MSLLPDIATILPTLLGGLKISLLLTFFSLLIGLPIGLIFSFGIVAPNRVYRYICVFFVEVGRGAPALVLLQLMYYGLPNVNITLTSLVSACLALIWTTSAYTAELLRGGIQSVPGGEIEGSDALGMSTADRLRFIVIPQGLRIALPSLMGFAVLLFQATSLAYTVAVPELMSQAYSTGSSTFKYLPAFIAAGLIYAAISVPATWLSVLTEKRLSRHL